MAVIVRSRRPRSLILGVDGGAGAAAARTRVGDRRRGARREGLGGLDHVLHRVSVS